MNDRVNTSRVLSAALVIACIGQPGCDEMRAHAAVAPPPSARSPTLEHAPPPSPAAPLDEARAVDVLGTLNGGEISLARYALTRATAPDVRDLAQMMIDQHTEVQANVADWAATASVAAQSNEVSTTVDASVATVRAQLEATPAQSFDAAYAQSQVSLHRDALTILDERLIPGAHDASFRALLTTIRAGIATHLAHATAIAAAH